MRMVDLIMQKRQGNSLAKSEIDFIIAGYTLGEIPDYQLAAWLMAVYFKGMNDREIADLTAAMVDSGDRIDLSLIEGIKVDKHSTGGVGDKISLIVGPLVASVGVPVAKMSGRGLGHTGGTIDKLESIQGFHVELTNEQFIHNVNRMKLAIVGQSGNLAPADKKIYALRDVTGTVDSIPLIASSIMSKKIASGADCIVLDVKVGSGAFMKSLPEARRLAQTMVDIGNTLDRKTMAVITDMNQPLGYEVGNANEVKEAIEVLKGHGPDDLNEISLTLGAYMALYAGIYPNVEEAREGLQQVLTSGKALQTFKQFIAAQGGNIEMIERTELLPQANHHVEVHSSSSGYVHGINAESVGIAAMMLGAGRSKKDEAIDHAAGISLLKKVGDSVEAGQPLCIMHTNRASYQDAAVMLKNSYTISSESPQQIPYIHEIIT